MLTLVSMMASCLVQYYLDKLKGNTDGINDDVVVGYILGNKQKLTKW